MGKFSVINKDQITTKRTVQKKSKNILKFMLI